MNAPQNRTIKSHSATGVPKIDLDADYETLFNTVKNYEERIKEIEESNYWKFFLFITKAKLVLTSDSYLKSDKWRFFQRVRFLFSKLGLFLVSKFFKQLFSLLFNRVNKMVGIGKGYATSHYDQYKQKNFPRKSDLEQMEINTKFFQIKPEFELFVLVNNENFKHLNAFLNALDSQIYPSFHVRFLADSPTEMIRYTLQKITSSDSRFSCVNYQNTLVDKPESDKDFIVFAGLQTVLLPHTLFQFADQINKIQQVDFIYSDNDFFEKGETESSNPYFKPQWSPHTLLSRNYIGDLFAVSNALFLKTDLQSYTNIYSLVLNLTHNAKHIKHIPKVLYHQFRTSLTSYRVKKDHQALNRFIAATYPKSYAKLSDTALGCYKPEFKLHQKPLVSIIIPAKNKSAVLDQCLKSLLENLTYPHYEIIIIDNGSSEKCFFSTVAQYEFNYPDKVKCYPIDIPFNYSVLNNSALQYCNGEYLLFLNNDTQLISHNLIEELLKLASQENVGAVGPKLLYPNNTIQHAGIVLSLDETGAHVYSGAHKDTSGYFNNTNCLNNYSAVTGACMMISREKFEFAGGFDPNLAVDCNDVELCCRLFSLGFYNVYVPWASMYHYECLTRGNPMLSSHSILRQQNEKSYFLNKWGTMIKDDPFYNKNLTRISKNYELTNS